jgi:hypothetical protein
MQFAPQFLQGSWTEPVGWLSIVAGLALATWTLRQNSRWRVGPALGQLLGRSQAPHSSATDLDNQWQRLTDIVESGIARTEALPNLQARAAEEIEAVDGAVGLLLAELTLPEAALTTRGELEPTPGAVAEPLAA